MAQVPAPSSNAIPSVQINGVLEDLSLDSVPLTEKIPGRHGIDTWTDPVLPRLPRLGRDSGSTGKQVKDRLWNTRVDNPFLPTLNHGFWPPILFEHIFDRHTISEIIRELCGKDDPQTATALVLNSGSYSGRELENIICGTSNKNSFRRVLAVLVLMKRANDIGFFISAGITDKALPCDVNGLMADTRSQAHSLKEWSRMKFLKFGQYQRMLCVPVLEMPMAGVKINHYQFRGDDNVPWVDLSTSNFSTPSDPLLGSMAWTAWGGYGEVSKVVIHAWQHKFNEILRSVRANIYTCLVLILTPS